MTKESIDLNATSLPLWNKSSVTNLVAASVVGISYVSPFYKEQLLGVGLFSLSGALTNWLAVHMLFEKIPGLYGSGIIPNRFNDFKEGIQDLIMTQFFTEEHISRFLASSEAIDINPDPILDALDYDELFTKLVQAIESSPMASLLAMMGGAQGLDPIKPAFQEKMKEALAELSKSDSFRQSLSEAMRGSGSSGNSLIPKIDDIVRKRLDELTPEMVKVIIQNMIRKHLGWLVVWGGVFGGIIGLAASFL